MSEEKKDLEVIWRSWRKDWKEKKSKSKKSTSI